MAIRYTHGSRSLYRLYHVVVDVSLEGEALCGFDLRGLTILSLEPIGMILCPFCEKRVGRLGVGSQVGRCFRPLIEKPAPAPRNDADYSESATRRSGRLDSDREFLVAPLERHSVARLLYLDVG